MAPHVRLKTWFASVAPAAQSSALAVWFYGLPDSDGDTASPVAFQLKERLARDRFKSEVRGEQLEVHLVGELDVERAAAAGVLEVYQKSFAAGITEHLEFLLVAARATPPHIPDLRAAFPPPAPRDPLEAARSGSDSLPPSLFDLGTGYCAPKGALKSRRELAEELRRAKVRRNKGKGREEEGIRDDRAPYSDRDAWYEEQGEEDEDVEMHDVEPAPPGEQTASLDPATFNKPAAALPGDSAPPAVASSPTADPGVAPMAPPPASVPSPISHPTLSVAAAPSPSRSSNTATTPTGPIKPPSRIAATVFAFFRDPSARTSPPRSNGTKDAIVALEEAVARTLAEQLARQPAAHVTAPPPSAGGAEDVPRLARTVATDGSLVSAEGGCAGADESREATAELAPGKNEGKVCEGEVAHGHEEARETVGEVVVEIVVPVDGSTASPPVAHGAVTGLVHEGDIDNFETVTLETSVTIEGVTEVELEKVEEVDEGEDVAIDAHGDPVVNDLRSASEDGTVKHGFHDTPHSRVSPHLYSSPLLSSSRQSSPADAFPASSGGISSLFHASSDEEDGEDTSADLTAQAISEFVERDLASSIVDEDEYVAERLRPATTGAMVVESRPRPKVQEPGPPQRRAKLPFAAPAVPPSSSRESSPQPAASGLAVAKEDSPVQASPSISSPPEWREPDLSSFDAPAETVPPDEAHRTPDPTPSEMVEVLLRQETTLVEMREEALEPSQAVQPAGRPADDVGNAVGGPLVDAGAKALGASQVQAGVAALELPAPASEDADMRDLPSPEQEEQFPASGPDSSLPMSSHQQSFTPAPVDLPAPALPVLEPLVAAWRSPMHTPPQARSSTSPRPAALTEAEREVSPAPSINLVAVPLVGAVEAEASSGPVSADGAPQEAATGNESAPAAAVGEQPASSEELASSPACASEATEPTAAAETTLLDDDVVRDTVEKVVGTAAKEFIGTAVGTAVAPITGPVLGDAVSELASDLVGDVVGEVVGDVVDATATVVDSLARDEASPVQETTPSHAVKELSPAPQPQDQPEPEHQTIQEPVWFPPEESKDWMDDDPFAAPVVKDNHVVRKHGKGKRREKEGAFDNGILQRKSASRTAIDLLAPSPFRQHSPSFVSADTANTGAHAALAALRNEATPAPDFYGSGAPSSDARTRSSQPDVFAPVVSSQARRAIAGPSSRTPRTRTASTAGGSSPIRSSSPVSAPAIIKDAEPLDAAWPGTVKKPSPWRRGGLVFDCVEIPVHAKKGSSNPQAYAAAAPFEPIASTSSATAPSAGHAEFAGPVELARHRSASPPPPSSTKAEPSAIFLADSAGPTTAEPEGGLSWLDAPPKTSRPSPQKYGSTSSRARREPALPSDEDESEDPLASGPRRGHGATGRTKVARIQPEQEDGSEDEDEDEEVARRLLSPKGKGRADAPPLRRVGTPEHDCADEVQQDFDDDDEPIQHSASRSRSRARKRVMLSSSPPAVASPPQKKPRRSALLAPHNTVPPARKPSLAGKNRPPLTGKAPRASLAPVTPATPARDERLSGTPGSSARPSRVRKPATRWWDLQRGAETAEAGSVKKRAWDDEDEPEQEGPRPAPPTKKAKVPRAAKRVIAATRGPTLQPADPDPEPDGEDPVKDLAFEKDEPVNRSPSPTPEPEPQPAPTRLTAPAKKRKKRKSVVMPRYKNRHRASTASASQASPVPQPQRKSAATSLSRATGVKAARKGAAVHHKAKVEARGAVDMPDWTEGDNWAGLREVGIAREASEDGYTFSD
ncbi:hypothetical protein JCM3770_002751 [Rhodotorula araucariae]